MHWIVQNNLFREETYGAMLEALQRLNVKHTIVSVQPFVDELEPEPDIGQELVYICGSVKLGRIARERKWFPGCFLNTKTMRYEAWDAAIGEELLNHGGTVAKFGTAELPAQGEFHVRPCEDTKAFSGKCFYKAEFDSWRQNMIDSEGIIIDGSLRRHKLGLTSETDIVIAPVQSIQREYRFFVVDGKVVTGSLYKLGGKACYSNVIDQDAQDYAQAMVDEWQPDRAFVMDIAQNRAIHV